VTDAVSGITPREISDVASSQLPTDCMVPQTRGKCATPNTTHVFTSTEKFTSGGSLLNLQPSSYLHLWEWREKKVNLIGATQAVTVHLRDKKVPRLLTRSADPVQIRSATDPLAFATAALLVARSCSARPSPGSARHGAKWPPKISSSATSAWNRPRAAGVCPAAISAESYICDGCF